MSSEKSIYVSPDFLRKSAEFLKELKLYTYQRIREEAPSSILDIGCGPGIDTVAMARETGPKTQIIGIDSDPGMIDQANMWAFSQGVEDIVHHRKADAGQLPFEPASFDAVRSERLFQHLENPIQKEQVFRESLRVLKPGGIAIMADTDWASVSVDFPDPTIERKMITFLADMLTANGYAARQLYGMFRTAELQDIQIKIFPLLFQNLQFTPVGKFLVKEAQKADLIPQKELNQWLEILEEKDKKGLFFCSLNMLVVSGRKK